jgi:hypothetical protein
MLTCNMVVRANRDDTINIESVVVDVSLYTSALLVANYFYNIDNTDSDMR